MKKCLILFVIAFLMISCEKENFQKSSKQESIQFRLKVTDVNGKVSYSAIKMVKG